MSGTEGAPDRPDPALSFKRTTTRRSWWPVVLVMFVVAWGGNEFTPLLVMYRELGAFSDVAVDALLAAYVLGIAPAMLIGGPLSDRYGRRPLLLPAAPIALAGSLVLAAGESSAVLLGVGRILSGVALGLAMAVGTSWVKELSDAAPRQAASKDAALGARRAGLALTIGFLVGAAVAAGLAQWAPYPTHFAYLLHAFLSAIGAIALLVVPETRPAEANTPTRKRLLDDLKIPAIAHRRFLRIAVPVAPWVFGCAACAYAVLPALMSEYVGSLGIAFSGLMTIVALGAGVGIQVVARAIDTHHSARASVVAMTIVVLGMMLGAIAAWRLDLFTALVAAAVLGAGYGLALVAGLSEVQRIARPDDLAGLTAVFYALSYTGFFVPLVLAKLSTWWGYPNMFVFGAVMAVISLVVVAAGWRAHLPAYRSDLRELEECTALEKKSNP